MPSEIRAAERVQLCAENNADLYDAVFRAHNLSSARTGAFWSSHRTAPTYYSNLVALSSAKTEEQLQEIENLKQSIEGIFFVKDSYHALDLSDHGFQLLFTSTWIWGEPEALTAPLSLPPTWVKISKQQDLDLWQKIWMESGSPADKPVFAPDILSDANVAILGRRDSNGGFDGGCIANRSSDVIGISNIFAKEGAPSAAAGAIGAASTAFGSKLPLVGYENGDDLAEMRISPYKLTIRHVVIPSSGPARAAALAEKRRAARNLTRIAFITNDDHKRASDLLQTLLLHPDAASSIKEFTIAPAGVYTSYGFRSRNAKENRVWEQHAAAHLESALGNHILLEQCLLALVDCDEEARAAGLRAVYEQVGLSIGDHAPKPIPEYEILEQDAIPILLLWICTNLETLRLSDGYIAHWHLEQYINLVNYGRLPGLANVKRVEFATPTKQSQDDRFFDVFHFTRSVQLVHRLPKLESVLFQAARELDVGDYRIIPRCGNMKRLELSHVDISCLMFATLISIPKELEELKVWLGGFSSHNGGLPYWIARYAWRLLLPHKDTLTSLDIDTDISIFWVAPNNVSGHEEDYDELSEDGEEFMPPVFREFKEADRLIGSNYAHEDIKLKNTDVAHVVYGSFSDFRALKHLRIGVVSLLGPTAQQASADDPRRLHDLGVRLVDLLPPSLESFALYGYERGYCKDVDDQVDELMEVKGEKFPMLVNIEGIQDTIGSIDTVYGGEPEEGKEWDRGEQDWGWK